MYFFEKLLGSEHNQAQLRQLYWKLELLVWKLQNLLLSIYPTYLYNITISVQHYNIFTTLQSYPRNCRTIKLLLFTWLRVHCQRLKSFSPQPFSGTSLIMFTEHCSAIFKFTALEKGELGIKMKSKTLTRHLLHFLCLSKFPFITQFASFSSTLHFQSFRRSVNSHSSLQPKYFLPSQSKYIFSNSNWLY